MKRLDGKTAIVTGASSGIGRALALALAQCGAAVVLQARREELLAELCREIENAGGRALACTGDAGSSADTERLLERALEWPAGGRRYDMVVANAGRGLAGGIIGSDESQWQELIQTNILGVAHLARRAGVYLKERGCGDIVIISSVVGSHISPFSGFYGASKFAVTALAEALRREICASGVRVATVNPGIVISGFQEVAGYTRENFGKTVETFGKVLQPEEVAESIVWLLSQPAHLNISDITIRPTGQDYP